MKRAPRPRWLRRVPAWIAWPAAILLTVLGTVASTLAGQGPRTLLLTLILGSVASVFALIAQTLPRPADTRAGAWWDSERPPYPGLESFAEDDARVFFGRDTEVQELIERVTPGGSARSNRFVAVIGPSGSGKSSLVYAGLLPRLRRSRRRWTVLGPFVPGQDPVGALDEAVGDGRPDRPSGGPEPTGGEPGWATDLAVERLAARLARRRAGNASVLLVIDQFEEAFTLAPTAERNLFLDLLDGLLRRCPWLSVVATLRSEFITNFLSTTHAALCQRPVVVGFLATGALAEAIEGPAAVAGVRLAPGLAARIVADSGGGGEATPLVAYLMRRIYERIDVGGTATHELYDQLGGVTGALRRQADRVRADLVSDGVEDAVIMATLLRFVTLEGGEPTRRRVRRSQLSATELAVARAFIEARLLISRGTDDPVIDVAHEALFRHWPPLRQEVEARGEDLRRRAQMRRWAEDWDGAENPEVYLLTGERLRLALDWHERDPDAAADPVVAAFVDASRQHDRAWLRRLSESVARHARQSLDEDPERAVLLALAAIRECHPTVSAFRALHTALRASRVRAVLRGHEGWIWGVHWSADGYRIASASHDCTIRVWHAGTGETLAVLSGHTDRVAQVAWSPDGTRLASSSHDATVRIWQPGADRPEQLVLRGHGDRVEALAWSPAGDRVVSGSRDRTARIWDAGTGRALAATGEHGDWVQAVDWSPDAALVATGSGDRTVCLWGVDGTAGADPVPGPLPVVARLSGHTDWVESVAWAPDGRFLASAARDLTVRIWDVPARRQRLVLTGHQAMIDEVRWSHDGRRLLTAAHDATARVWDADEGTAELVLRGHGDWVTGAAWAPDDRDVATASRDGTVRLWQVVRPVVERTLAGHASWVRAVAWSPDGGRVATGSRDGGLIVWDGAGHRLRGLVGHDDAVRGLAWLDRERVVSASYDGTARVWDVVGGAPLVTFEGHGSPVRCVAVHPDGARVATGSRDGRIRVWDARDGREIAVLEGHAEMVRALHWAPDGLRLASGSNDATARTWTADGEPLAVLQGHQESINGIRWAPQGDRVLTVSRDRTARMWDPVSAAELYRVGEHEDVPRWVDWARAGEYVAIAYDDDTARVWDLQAMVETVVLRGHAAWVECVAWSPDGAWLATSSGDHTARLWPVAPSADDLLRTADARVFRPLTEDERQRYLLGARV